MKIIRIIKRQVSLFRIFGKNFITNFPGPFYGFVLPLILLIIIYIIFRGSTKEAVTPAGSQIRGLLLLPTISTGLVGLSSTLVEWKESILLKRIKVTSLHKSEFIIGILIFYTFASIIGFFWILLWSYVILKIDNASYVLKTINWGWMMLGVILTSMIAICLGVLIGGVCKNQATAQGVTLSIFFPLVFLSGVMIPLFLIDGSYGMRIFTYFIPLKYPVFINDVAWNSGHLPSVNPRFPQFSKEFSALWQAPVATLGIIILLLTIDIKTFKLTV